MAALPCQGWAPAQAGYSSLDNAWIFVTQHSEGRHSHFLSAPICHYQNTTPARDASSGAALDVSILPMTTAPSLPMERTILKLCRAKQPKPKQLSCNKSFSSRWNPKQSKESGSIWLSCCVWVCVEGSPALQEDLVGKEQLLTKMTSSFISCVIFRDWGGNTEISMDFVLSCPTSPPTLHYIYILLTGRTSNASATTQMAQEWTSSGPTNMERESPLQEESKIDLPQHEFGQKSEYYT